MNDRLSLVSPELSQRLRQSHSVAVLRRIAFASARRVLERTELQDERVDAALSSAEDDSWTEQDRSALRSLADEFDDQYWRAQDSGESEIEYLRWFGCARAVSSLSFALDPDPRVGTCEAVYEAHCAFADGSGVVETATQMLADSEDG